MGGYSTELIQKTRWKSVSEKEVISEDVFSLLRLYKDVTKVVVVSEPLYFYCENLSSLTHTYRKDRLYKLNMFYELCVAEIDKLGYTDECKKRIEYGYLSDVIAALKSIVSSDGTEQEKIFEVREIIEDKKLQAILSRTRIRKEQFKRKMLFKAMQKKKQKIVYFMVKIKA